MTPDPTYEKLLEGMEDNSLVQITNATGSRLVARLRGCSAQELGELFGLATKQLQTQIAGLRERVIERGGSAVDFDFGYLRGLSASQETMMFRDVPKPEGGGQ
jgi:hypothetical protein